MVDDALQPAVSVHTGVMMVLSKNMLCPTFHLYFNKNVKYGFIFTKDK